MEERPITFGKYVNGWRCCALLSSLAFIGVLIALIVVIVVYEGKLDDQRKDTMPCPPTSTGGLMTSGDPVTPSSFHDLTTEEYERVYRFLRSQEKLNLKAPVDDEYRVGPLSAPTYVKLDNSSQRRNPVQFSLRPVGNTEVNALFKHVMPTVDQKVGHILRESYQGRFTDCVDDCLTLYAAPVGSQLLGQITRRIWVIACYPVEYYTLHPLDFGLLLNLEGSDPSQWRVEQVWYSGAFYSSLDDLAGQYGAHGSSAVNKTRRDYVRDSPHLTSSQRLRGDPVPPSPQRPPLQTAPDGKRYSVHHRHVTYLHWEMDFRLSAFTGPQVYDVRFQGERIAYELGVAEISVFYAGFNPMQRVTNFVDSGALIGTHSKSLIPGVDCPEDATFLNVSFFGEGMERPTEMARAQCVFEQNTGVPLRRHMSYSKDQGAFYGGMADSVLVLRSILTILNYDYVVDFIFHQSGAIECRAISTGYIMATFYSPREAPYGFRLNDDVGANLHHHMFHFKADLDIGGVINRYETLDISQETVQLQQLPGTSYRQIKFQRHLYNTEDEAVYKFNFDQPKYHLVHNEQKKTKHGVPRAYRLHMASMSKQLLTAGEDNEKSIAWARQQLAVTVHSDDEVVSSSPYAMFDSLDPVTDFTNFIDGQSIVDEDLVLWVTLGTHHIPHTEDIPVTSTVGGHLAFFLLPYNYFPECPSVSSRDNVRVDYVTPHRPEDGLKVDRSGNRVTDQCGALTLEQLAKQNPDHILQTHREFKLF